MIKFSKEKVLLLHQIMAEATGGSVGVRDEGLLDSALEGAFAGFGDQEFYPTKEEKGARLGYTLISNHAFVDGNKLQFFILAHLNLRFSIQIDYEQFRAVVFEYDNSALLFSKPGNPGKVLIGFRSSYNGVCIDIHTFIPPSLYIIL